MITQAHYRASACAPLLRRVALPVLALVAASTVGSALALPEPAMLAPVADASPMPDADRGDMSADRMMMGVLGAYGMARDASGTAWQPDSSAHEGLHLMRGDWMLMAHGLFNEVHDWQQGPRGGSDTFLSGIFMGMATLHRPDGDTLQLRAMLSPEPLMGKAGYPLLLQTGETANGRTPLIDRQHPHNLFMEMAASYSLALSPSDSVFAYAGLPGEPAFGPPAFMHRQSIADSPEAPITHHWLDSTHVTFGVATLGVVHDRWKMEASRFHGREPDQFRDRIEPGALDSSSARVSWNPAPEWSLQGSWAYVVSPEQLEPQKNQHRLSASVIYTRPVGSGAWWSTTMAWGRRRSTGEQSLKAYAIESTLNPSEHWSFFVRGEREDNNELAPVQPAASTYEVGKVSVGVLRDVQVSEHWVLGLGVLYAFNFVPQGLKALYGGQDPQGAMVFVRAKLN